VGLRVETTGPAMTPGSAGYISAYASPIDPSRVGSLPPPRAAFAAPPSSPTASSQASHDASSPVSNEKGSPTIFRVTSEHDSLAGPDNDRMRPAGGEKVDFWRRFSMVAAEAEAQPVQAKKRCAGGRRFSCFLQLSC
jgi:hypothetical protein